VATTEKPTMASTRPSAAISWWLNSPSTLSVRNGSACAVPGLPSSADPAMRMLQREAHDLFDRRIAPNTPVIPCPNPTTSASRRVIASGGCGRPCSGAKPSGYLRVPQWRACRESSENIGNVTLTVRVQTVNAATTRRQFRYRRLPQHCRHRKRINQSVTRGAGRGLRRGAAAPRRSPFAGHRRSRARPSRGPAR